MAWNDPDIIDQLHKDIPCRQTEIDTLAALFSLRSQSPCQSIFIFGHTATGKSLVVESLLEKLQFGHVLLNCVECYSQRLLYETILNGFSNEKPSATNGFDTSIRCDNMNDFIRLLKGVITERGLEEEVVYIVLDKAERLRDMEANILPAFLRLHELSGLNICVILLSEIVWDKFRNSTGFLDPLVLHFSDYSKDQLVEIMTKDCPEEYPEDFYASFVALVLSVFYLACRNLKELRHLALLNFPKYVEPVKAGDATVNEHRKLWRNIEPHLKKALQTVYLREVSSAQWERMQELIKDTKTMDQQLQSEGLSARSHIELPFYSKYLLIASYLASYNPAKSDRRFFAKNAGKMSKRSKLMKRNERTSNQLLGPKPFPLDRMMAIFYSIVEGRVAPTANILSQISSLVTLRLMTQAASEDQLDSPKYKCLVSLDFIRLVAKTVQFDVLRYLYDFI